MLSLSFSLPWQRCVCVTPEKHPWVLNCGNGLAVQAEGYDHAGFNRSSNCHLHFAASPLERVDPTCLRKGRIGRNKSLLLVQHYTASQQARLANSNLYASYFLPRLGRENNVLMNCSGQKLTFQGSDTGYGVWGLTNKNSTPSFDPLIRVWNLSNIVPKPRSVRTL
jgi:hypothetical protein